MSENITIKPYPKNAKTHSKKQIQQIANSIKEFGFNQPIVVDKKGVIIVGHGRFEAAKLLGIDNPPVVVADLTPKQAQAYRIADNRLNETSDWDMELVLEELKGLSGDLVELTGFDMEKISDEFNDFGETNAEVNISDVKSKLVHKCPKCGFEFSKS